MITAASLRSYTSKDLAQMAKKKGVSGWHSMRKEQLVRAILSETKKKAKKKAASANGKTNGKVASGKSNGAKATKSPKSTSRATTSRLSSAKSPSRTAKSPARAVALKSKSRKPSRKSTPPPQTSPRVARRIKDMAAAREEMKDLARKSSLSNSGDTDESKDRIVLLVRDPFWLQTTWSLNRHSIERVKAAMSEHWHGAKPIIRLYLIESINTTSTSESVIRDIEIHGGVSNWYIDVIDPPKSYRVAIGYLSLSGQFFAVARSNKVITPKPGNGDALDENWKDIAEDCDKVYALSGGFEDAAASSELKEVFEERLRRPMDSPVSNKYGLGADSAYRVKRGFQFEVDAEIVIFGATQANANINLAGEPIKVRDDGTFSVRLSMPDKRQVLPIVARSGDGVEQRTTVLAIERNTKVMEPQIHEHQEV